jgi:L-threonylcarbamoyladenylate synthase
MPPVITTDIDAAVDRLHAGGLVAIPTETVYGLAALADLPAAVAAVFQLKGRPSSHPLIVHVGAPDWVRQWARDPPPGALRLMDAFWPGPLTLVLDALPTVSRDITAGQDTVALRMPDHPVCLELLRRLNRAVVAPSANRFTQVSPTRAAHVAQQFPDSELLILDGGPCRVGVESTIVALRQDTDAARLERDLLKPGLLKPELLRPGMIAVDALATVLGAPLLHADSSTIRAPGQHRRHYAPRTPAWTFTDRLPCSPEDTRIGWIFCGNRFATAGPALDLGPDPAAYAAGLYAALHTLDAAHLRGIAVAQPPGGLNWQAVHDRLRRATGHAPSLM